MSDDSKLVLEEFLAYRVVRFAHKLSTAVADVYTGPYALNVAQWRVLATLAEQDGLTANAIAARTAMDKVKVSRAIKLLVSRDLLSRHASASDARAFLLSLTKSGRQLYEQVVPQARAWQARLLDGISPADYAIFMQVISKLEERLDRADIGHDG